MALDPSNAPFGTHHLPPFRRTILSLADHMPNGRVGQWCISLCRKLALWGTHGPYDITTPLGLKLRLHPSDNRCEKRMVAGGHIWDHREHAALAKALATSQTPDHRCAPFVFVDVGANVGLYGLLLAQRARLAGRPFKGLAIEPDSINAARLQANIGFNDASIAHVAMAVGGTSGYGQSISQPGASRPLNRGEMRIETIENDMPNAVPIRTLTQIVTDQGIDHIDAMKVDIEGHDHAALSAFFQTAKQDLWPHLLIIEVGRGTSTVLDLCLGVGYQLVERAGINAILTYVPIEAAVAPEDL